MTAKNADQAEEDKNLILTADGKEWTQIFGKERFQDDENVGRRGWRAALA